MIAPLQKTAMRHPSEQVRKRRMRRARQVIASAFFDSAQTPYRAVPCVAPRLAWAIVIWMSACATVYFTHLIADGLLRSALP